MAVYAVFTVSLPQGSSTYRVKIKKKVEITRNLSTLSIFSYLFFLAEL